MMNIINVMTTLILFISLNSSVGLSADPIPDGERYQIKYESIEVNPVDISKNTVKIQPFRVVDRSSLLEKFPCSKCHRDGSIKFIPGKSKLEKAHWNISLRHATDATMDCRTCHSSDDPSKLVLLKGSAVPLSRAYQVCAQCHFKQVEDWTGGAHGKRIGGWTPPRLVQTCTGCHDPHFPIDPKKKNRWPVIKSESSTHSESDSH